MAENRTVSLYQQLHDDARDHQRPTPAIEDAMAAKNDAWRGRSIERKSTRPRQRLLQFHSGFTSFLIIKVSRWCFYLLVSAQHFLLIFFNPRVPAFESRFGTLLVLRLNNDHGLLLHLPLTKLACSLSVVYFNYRYFTGPMKELWRKSSLTLLRFSSCFSRSFAAAS